MGMFQQFKQLRETTAALPGMMAEAGALRGAAQGYAGHNAVVTPRVAGLPADDPRLVPVAGVDLASYARVVKTSVQTGRSAADVALELGVETAAWQAAAAGWPARMSGDMALAVEYGNLYASVA